jgi:hypothetical protein
VCDTHIIIAQKRLILPTTTTTKLIFVTRAANPHFLSHSQALRIFLCYLAPPWSLFSVLKCVLASPDLMSLTVSYSSLHSHRCTPPHFLFHPVLHTSVLMKLPWVRPETCHWIRDAFQSQWTHPSFQNSLFPWLSKFSIFMVSTSQ